MKKKYCKNCKWYQEKDEDPLGIAGGSCLHSYCRKHTKYLDEIEPTPINDKCYERKWWKFWLKSPNK